MSVRDPRLPSQELAQLPPLVLFAAGIVGRAEAARHRRSGSAVAAGRRSPLVWALTVRHARRATPSATGPSAPGRRCTVRGGPALVGTGTIVAVARSSRPGSELVAPPVRRAHGRRGPTSSKPFDPRDYVSPLSGFRAYEEAHRRRTRPSFAVTGLPRGRLRPHRDARHLRRRRLPGRRLRRSRRLGHLRPRAAVGRRPRSSGAPRRRRCDGRRVPRRLAADGRRPRATWRSPGPRRRRPTAAAFFYNAVDRHRRRRRRSAGRHAYDLTRRRSPTSRPTSSWRAAPPGDAAVPAPTRRPRRSSATPSTSTTADVADPGAKLVAAIAGTQAQRVRQPRVSATTGAAGPATVPTASRSSSPSPLMVGDQEQYAAAAALMADHIGFPARVVMGFTAGR